MPLRIVTNAWELLRSGDMVRIYDNGPDVIRTDVIRKRQKVGRAPRPTNMKIGIVICIGLSTGTGTGTGTGTCTGTSMSRKPSRRAY